MLVSLWISGYVLILIGLIGLVIQNKELLGFLMALEIALLGVSLQFSAVGVLFGDIFGQIFSFFVMSIAAAESAIGLGLLVMSQRLFGECSFRQLSNLRG